MSALLQVDGLVLSFGGRPLLDGISFVVEPRARIALVGRNGSGKSTLMKILAGQVEAQDGTIFRQPGTTVGYLPQEPDLSGHATVADYVLSGVGAVDDPKEALRLMDRLSVNGDADPAKLSGGEIRRAAIARMLGARPDILLMDEPTNHLDLPTIEWLERDLADRRGTLLMISHDRRFLEAVTNATLWLDRGEARMLDDGFSAFEAWRDRVLEQEELDAHKLKRKIAREEDWVRYGVSARRTRNMRRLGELDQMKADYRNRERAAGKAEMQLTEAGQSGKRVLEAKGVSKAFAGRSVVSDFSIRVQRGDRIGLVGANGSGKTTLVRLLTGETEPDTGHVQQGLNLEIARFEQMREGLDPERTLADFLTDGRGDTMVIGETQRHVTAYMKDFLFRPEQARTPVSALSGGEQARLLLARLFARPSNLLVLDEPTNDLDLETLDVLQEALAVYEGTVFLISHDRDFLDRTVSTLIVAEGDGRFTRYAGGYSDMLSQRGTSPFAERKTATSKVKAEKPAAAPTKPVRKLSYKDQYALDTLPGEIDALKLRKQEIEKALADPALYASDPARFAKLGSDLAALDSDIAAKEERWLELEILKEEIGG